MPSEGEEEEEEEEQGEQANDSMSLKAELLKVISQYWLSALETNCMCSYKNICISAYVYTHVYRCVIILLM